MCNDTVSTLEVTNVGSRLQELKAAYKEIIQMENHWHKNVILLGLYILGV